MFEIFFDSRDTFSWHVISKNYNRCRTYYRLCPTIVIMIDRQQLSYLTVRSTISNSLFTVALLLNSLFMVTLLLSNNMSSSSLRISNRPSGTSSITLLKLSLIQSEGQESFLYTVLSLLWNLTTRKRVEELIFLFISVLVSFLT